jgi:hypothetical protein
MLANETSGLKGHINLKLYDANGNLKSEVDKANVVVTVGKNFTAAWLAATSQANPFMNYIALGTGTSAAAAGDTALETEIGTRVAGTISSSTNIWTNQATFGPGVSTGAITEAGIFSASSGGTMLARQSFAVQNKLAGDTIVFTWNVTLS